MTNRPIDFLTEARTYELSIFPRDFFAWHQKTEKCCSRIYMHLFFIYFISFSALHTSLIVLLNKTYCNHEFLFVYFEKVLNFLREYLIFAHSSTFCTLSSVIYIGHTHTNIRIYYTPMAHICWSAHFQLGKQSYRSAATRATASSGLLSVVAESRSSVASTQLHGHGLVYQCVTVCVHEYNYRSLLCVDSIGKLGAQANWAEPSCRSVISHGP